MNSALADEPRIACSTVLPNQRSQWVISAEQEPRTAGKDGRPDSSPPREAGLVKEAQPVTAPQTRDSDPADGTRGLAKKLTHHCARRSSTHGNLIFSGMSAVAAAMAPRA